MKKIIIGIQDNGYPSLLEGEVTSEEIKKIINLLEIIKKWKELKIVKEEDRKWLKERLRQLQDEEIKKVETSRTIDKVRLLSEVISTLGNILKDDGVNDNVKQALRTATTAINSAIKWWDKSSIRNLDKNWRDILWEVSHEPSVLWRYATVLRGPDKDNSWPSAKVLLTCPLRGRTVMALDVEDFLTLGIDDVVRGFIGIKERKEELYHYLQHIISVWECFYLPIAMLLRDVFFVGSIKVDIGAIRYVKLIHIWLQSTSAIIAEE